MFRPSKSRHGWMQSRTEPLETWKNKAYKKYWGSRVRNPQLSSKDRHAAFLKYTRSAIVRTPGCIATSVLVSKQMKDPKRECLLPFKPQWIKQSDDSKQTARPKLKDLSFVDRVQILGYTSSKFISTFISHWERYVLRKGLEMDEDSFIAFAKECETDLPISRIIFETMHEFSKMFPKFYVPPEHENKDDSDSLWDGFDSFLESSVSNWSIDDSKKEATVFPRKIDEIRHAFRTDDTNPAFFA